jgi:hypothetical protein
MATVPAPPLIKFRLDFGKAGGQILPNTFMPIIRSEMCVPRASSPWRTNRVRQRKSRSRSPAVAALR